MRSSFPHLPPSKMNKNIKNDETQPRKSSNLYTFVHVLASSLNRGRASDPWDYSIVLTRHVHTHTHNRLKWFMAITIIMQLNRNDRRQRTPTTIGAPPLEIRTFERRQWCTGQWGCGQWWYGADLYGGLVLCYRLFRSLPRLNV